VYALSELEPDLVDDPVDAGRVKRRRVRGRGIQWAPPGAMVGGERGHGRVVLPGDLGRSPFQLSLDGPEQTGWRLAEVVRTPAAPVGRGAGAIAGRVLTRDRTAVVVLEWLTLVAREDDRPALALGPFDAGGVVEHAAGSVAQEVPGVALDLLVAPRLTARPRPPSWASGAAGKIHSTRASATRPERMRAAIASTRALPVGRVLLKSGRCGERR
jgi:hypothetical protein